MFPFGPVWDPAIVNDIVKFKLIKIFSDCSELHPTSGITEFKTMPEPVLLYMQKTTLNHLMVNTITKMGLLVTILKNPQNTEVESQKCHPLNNQILAIFSTSTTSSSALFRTLELVSILYNMVCDYFVTVSTIS